MNPYKKGRNFEYRVKSDLEKKGYYVIRSAGSHSKFDLVAVSQEEVLLIQCKTSKPSAKKVRETADLNFTLPQNVRVVFVYKKGRKICYDEPQVRS